EDGIGLTCLLGVRRTRARDNCGRDNSSDQADKSATHSESLRSRTPSSDQRAGEHRGDWLEYLGTLDLQHAFRFMFARLDLFPLLTLVEFAGDSLMRVTDAVQRHKLAGTLSRAARPIGKENAVTEDSSEFIELAEPHCRRVF